LQILASQPLLPFVLAFAAGICLNLEFGFFSPAFFLLAPLGLLGAAVAHALPRLGNKTSVLLLFFAVLLAGALDSEQEKQKLEAADSLIPFLDRGPVRLIGRLAEPVVAYSGYSRLTIEAEQVLTENRASPVAGRVRVNVSGEEPPAVKLGDRLILVAQLRRPQSFRNPGGFQYEEYLARRGIAVIGTAKGADEIYRIGEGSRWNPLSAVDRLRDRLAALITAQAPDHGGLLRALLLGEETAVPEAVWDAFRDTGLAHLLSISGLHLGMVAGMGFLLFRFLFGLSEWLMLRFNIRRLAGGVTFLLVLGYALLAGASVPTLRALIMVGVYVGALLLGRTYHLWNSLWLALLLILLFWPSALFEAGLQLSFAAVMGILYLLPRLWLLFPKTKLSFFPDPLQEPEVASFTRRYPFWKIGRYFFNLLFVSIAAQFGVALIAARYFHQLNPFAALHNLAAVPAVELLLLPPGLLVSALALPFPAAAGFGFRLLDHVSAFVEQMVAGFSAWPGAFILVRAPSLLELVLIYGFLILGLEGLIRRRRKRFSWDLLRPDISFRDPFGVEARQIAQTAAAQRSWPLWAGAITCLTLLLSIETSRLVSDRRDRDLRLTALDVGAGQCLLVRLPDHSRFLIDGGGFFNNIYDVGANVVAPYLLGQGIHSLTAVVLTHPHPDHGNGLVYILEHFRVGEFWLTADRNFLAEELLTIAARRSIPVRILDDQSPVTLQGETQIRILFPPPGPAGPHADLNDHALALRLSYRDRHILLPADMTSHIERRLLKQLGAPALRADLLIAPHHGSKSSSSSEFLEAVQPRAAIFSARPGGWYQMPHPQVIERYRERRIRILRTDRDGAVTVRTDGQSLEFESAVSPETAGTGSLF